MKKINIDKETLQQTLNNVSSKKEAAKQLGICVDTLSKLISNYELVFNSTVWSKGKKLPAKVHPEIDETWLITHWVNSEFSLRTLAKQYNIPDSLLESRVNKYKLTKNTKYKLNLNLLYDLTDPNIYYFAGLIATDGYLPEHLPDTLFLQLSGDSEYELLQNISKYYNSTCPIRTYGGTRHLLRWNQPGLHKFFVDNFNLTLKDKTFNVQVPNCFYNEDCIKAYVLGCLDGDGWISDKTYRVKLTTASEGFVKGLHDLIESATGIKIQYRLEYRKRQNKYYPTLEAVGKSAKDLLNWVYSGSNSFRLERKYNSFVKVNDIV